MAVAIRIAGVDDLPQLADLRREWTPGAPADPTFDARLADWFARERDHRTTWLATDGSRAVGMVSLVEFRRMPRPSRPDAHWGYIGQMFVSQPLRDRGIGARLLEALITEADVRGYVRLVLSPSARAVPFFARAGFVPAGADGGTPLFVRAAS